MKNIFKYIGVLSLSAVLFSSCQKSAADTIKREVSPLDTNAVQLFIFADTKDVAIKPAEGGKFAISSAEGTVERAEKKFPVVFGRHIDTEAQKAALSVPVIVTPSKEDIFAYKDTLQFAEGATVDTIWVETALSFGESGKLAFEIPEQYLSTYGGSSSAELNVAVDYTWLDRGDCTFTDASFFYFSGKVKIQMAKEFTNVNADTLFRLYQPYYDLAGDNQEYFKEGCHMNFLVDKNYNPITFGNAINMSTKSPLYINTGYLGGAYLCWFGPNSGAYGDYCKFYKSANSYFFSGLWLFEGAGYYIGGGDFTWETGCPESLKVDPAKYEAFLDVKLDTAAAMLVTKAPVVNPINETLASFYVPGSYKLSYPCLLTLSNGTSTTVLELLVPEDEVEGIKESGTYTFRSDDTTLGYSALKGYFDGKSATGSFFTTGEVMYYLVNGTVTWNNDADAGTGKVVIDAVSANGTPVKAEYDGSYIKLLTL